MRPNSDSWSQAKLILTKPALSGHVRELHLRDEVIHPDEPGAKLPNSAEQCLRQRMRFLTDMNVPAFADPELYQQRCMDIEMAQNEFALCIKTWIFEISELVRKNQFATIDRLTLTNAYDTSSTGRNPSYLRNYCGGVPTCSSGPEIFKSFRLLSLAQALGVKSMHIESLEYDDFPAGYLEETTALPLTQLRELDLTVWFNSAKTMPPLLRDRLRRGAVQALLPTMPNLWSLRLGVREDERLSSGFVPSRYLMKVLLLHRWQALETLELDNVAASEVEVVALVSRHRQTLRHLKLRKLRLGSWKRRESCVLRMLWTIGKVVEGGLESVELEGYLASREHGFTIRETGDEESMLARFKRYLCSGKGEDFPYPAETWYPLCLNGRIAPTNKFSHGLMGHLDRWIWEDDLMVDEAFPVESTWGVSSSMNEMSPRALEAWRDAILRESGDESWRSGEVWWEV